MLVRLGGNVQRGRAAGHHGLTKQSIVMLTQLNRTNF